MDDAIRLLKTQEMQGLPYDPATAAQAPVRCAANSTGFVYASAEIARESARRDRFEAAEQAEKNGFKPTPVPLVVPLAALPPASCPPRAES